MFAEKRAIEHVLMNALMYSIMPGKIKVSLKSDGLLFLLISRVLIKMFGLNMKLKFSIFVN